MEYDASFDPDEHGAEPIPNLDETPYDVSADDGEAAQDGAGNEDAKVYDDRSNDREGMSPLAIGILLVILLLLAGGAFWWFTQGRGDSGREADAATPGPAESPTKEEPVIEPSQPRTAMELPSLGASDEFVRQAAARLSEHPALGRWLANEDLVRRFVATVENVANGQSPRTHLDFMAPSGPFLARRNGDELVARPETYARYDLLVDVFTSLDIGTTVQLYYNLEPLFDEAYREIAPPGASFRDALSRAIDEMLAVEVPEEPPALEEAVVSYRYADPELEALSPAEKHLLRLGPERAARVQTKLQFLRAGLDLSSSRGSV